MAIPYQAAKFQRTSNDNNIMGPTCYQYVTKDILTECPKFILHISLSQSVKVLLETKKI